jgi:predicted glycogen debranching enzyme
MDIDRSLQLEWLEANGLGGFASSTISGANTRRYHGLLIAATKPPVGRYVLLSKFEETLIIGERRFELSCNLYPGVVHPRGFEYLMSFEAAPFPRFVYRVEGVKIEKRVFMIPGENTTVVEYEIKGEVPLGAKLELRPLIAFRDYHSTTHANGNINSAIDSAPNLVSIEPYFGLPRLYLAHNASSIEPASNWYFNFEYPVERERGLDFHEDLFCPLVAAFDLTATLTPAIIASTEEHNILAATGLRNQEIAHRQSVRQASPVDDPLVTTLVSAADQFIVKRDDLYSVIAGYPWFTDWGRDTMISLPGLTLVTGRHDIAKSILLAYAAHIDQGMLPNRFPDSGEAPEYNTVDAAFWFIEAVRCYLEHSGDIDLVRGLYDRLLSIIEWHLKGTRYGIRADSDGLLIAGGPGTQVTWMDAKIGDFVPTPRYGKPVEIQALWYNAVCFVASLSKNFGEDPAERLLSELAPRIQSSFNREFWNGQAGYLYDVVDSDKKDLSIRPNQVIALSLPYTMLSPEKARSIFAVVERELLTPFGLRTLAPSDPRYRGRYEGGPRERDAIYHQGAVWPWLLGPFVRAYLRLYSDSPQTRTQIAGWIAAFHAHIQNAGIVGQISEIFDGDAPHTPRGCPAQAWSVAELLRVIVEPCANSASYCASANANRLSPAPTIKYCFPSSR